MRRQKVQVVVLSAILAAVFVGIVQLREDSEPTYLTVDQVVRDPARWRGENVSVRGIVRPASIQRDPGGDWRFTVVSQGRNLSVRYTGVVPSTFVDAAEVVVAGELRDRELSARQLSVRVAG